VFVIEAAVIAPANGPAVERAGATNGAAEEGREHSGSWLAVKLAAVTSQRAAVRALLFTAETSRTYHDPSATPNKRRMKSTPTIANSTIACPRC
jgi:hypothetical protein